MVALPHGRGSWACVLIFGAVRRGTRFGRTSCRMVGDCETDYYGGRNMSTESMTDGREVDAHTLSNRARFRCRASTIAKWINRAISHPIGAIVGLVDELLEACVMLNCGLELDWSQNEFSIVLPVDGDKYRFEPPLLRSSVYRSIIARVSALCNERVPGEVSPYGGEGEVFVGGNPDDVVHAEFENTGGKFRLKLTPRG